MIQPLDIFCERTNGAGGLAIRTALSSRRKGRFVYTNHNAPVWADKDGNLYVTQIEPRYNKTFALDDYIRWLAEKKSEWFVCRFEIVAHMLEYDPTIAEMIQGPASEYWRSIHGDYYPLRDIWVIYRNLVLQPFKRLHLIKPDLAHVYCTEGCKVGIEKTNLDAKCLESDMPHPGHIEIGCRQKELVYVNGSRKLWFKVMQPQRGDKKI